MSPHLQTDISHDLRLVMADLLRPAPKESIIKWAEKNYYLDRTSASRGLWQASVTPYVIKPLLDFQNKSIREIVTVGPAQGSKTTPAIIALCFAAENAPGPMVYATAKDDKAKEASKDRISPALERCPGIRKMMSDNRHDKTIYTVRLKTCTIDIVGAQNPSDLESTPYRYVFGDECRRWPAGHLKLAEKRTRTYPNYKRWLFSTPGEKGDEFDQKFKATNQCEWFFPCMGCGQQITLIWKQLKYDGHPGDWNIDAIAPHIRYECVHCGHKHFDVPNTRRHMLSSGDWIAQNPNASSEKVGYRWNGLLPPWMRWRDIVDDWHSALEPARHGDLKQLQDFITDTLAEPWDPQYHGILDNEKPQKTAYTLLEIKEDDGDYRFFSVDVQQREFWGGVRAWWEDGHSKLLFPCNPKTWGEVSMVAERFKLVNEEAKYVYVDCGYDQVNVFENCAQNGWTALKGDHRGLYIHTLENGSKVKRLYSPVYRGDPASGTVNQGRMWCLLFHFADQETKDVLRFKLDRQGPLFDIPRDAPEWYYLQLHAEVCVEREQRTGQIVREWIRKRRANHIFDVEKMQIIAASMCGLLGVAAIPDVNFDNPASS